MIFLGLVVVFVLAGFAQFNLKQNPGAGASIFLIAVLFGGLYFLSFGAAVAWILGGIVGGRLATQSPTIGVKESVDLPRPQEPQRFQPEVMLPPVSGKGGVKLPEVTLNKQPQTVAEFRSQSESIGVPASSRHLTTTRSHGLAYVPDPVDGKSKKRMRNRRIAFAVLLAVFSCVVIGYKLG